MSLLLRADARHIPLADGSVHCCISSPPYYGLRDYGLGADGIGLEPTMDMYIASLVGVFREVRRALRDDGTLWLNLGDSYSAASTHAGRDKAGIHSHGEESAKALRGRNRNFEDGLKPKDLCLIPARVALALQADGWWLRSDIIWAKPNPMPESVTDRPTKAHEYLFLLAKSERYFYDAEAIMEPHETMLKYPTWTLGGGDQRPARGKNAGVQSLNDGVNKNAAHNWNPLGRNRRSVWTIATSPYDGAHFATFPPALVEPCIRAGCPEGGIVLDPFGGSGTVAATAFALGRRFVHLDLKYHELARERIPPMAFIPGILEAVPA